jgi:hypothetical protein
MPTTGGATGKVVAGFFSFTEVPEDARRAYNEWHQLDHLPSQYPLPGIVFGQRWNGTGEFRTARQVSAAPLDAADYVTLYLMADPLAETLTDFSDLARELRAVDRFFDRRKAVLSGPFSVEDRAAADRVQVSPETVPYRPTRGIYVLAERIAGAPEHRLDPDALVETDGVAGVWCFGPLDRRLPASIADRWHPGRHRVTVWFLDAEPLVVAPLLDPVARSLWEAAGTEPVLAGPFGAITPWQWD